MSTNFFSRNRTTTTKGNKMTDFTYTHRLSDDTAFTSDWVDDVYYAEGSHELVLVTHGRYYLYHHIPVVVYKNLVSEARRRGGSVGRYVNDEVKPVYGPSVEITKGTFAKSFNAIPTPSVIATPNVTVPDAIRTEVQYKLDGKVVFMKSTKPADQALEDYLVAVQALGLNAELEVLHVYFV